MKEKYNILFVSLFGDLTGGGQKSLFLLLKNLERNTYAPCLLCPSEGGLACEVRKLGIPVFIVPLTSIKKLNFFKIMLTINMLRKIIKESAIHIIHSESSRSIIYLWVAAKKLSIPIVWHARVSNPEPFLYERILYNVSTKVIAVSEGTKKRFNSLPQGVDKISLIYNAVDLETFHPAVDGTAMRKEFGVTNEVLVGIVGQIAAFKGQEEFVRAASNVLQKEQNVKFVIMGNDYRKYKNHIVALIKELSISDSVKIVHFHDNMPQALAAFDIIVNASYLEGFSRVIIEAMSLGKAVIATNVGGNPEAINDGIHGILVPPKDSQSLASAIIMLVKDEDTRRQLGRQARKRVEDFFSIHTHVEKIQNIYMDLMAKR
ncbi:MAG: glycosyltransferase family 4 protein [Candidatus Omnitrophica bacterium]|nr:glycosyltransferase family 4 protein [Candidatus Omnitrophota bacterium]